MLSDELTKHIKIKAEKLQYFLDSDGHSIGVERAIDKLTKWCCNFVGLLPNLDILIPVIDELTFIKDQDIIDRVIEELKRENNDLNSIYFSTLGGSNESSNRIIRNLNSNKNCIVNLHDCLKKIALNQESNSKIVFIDDFINSGGQFETIIKTLFGEKQIDSEDNQRIVFSKKEQEFFSNTNIIFYFYLGMQTGRELADKTIETFKLNAKIKIFKQYDDLSGIFGSSNSVEQIIHGSSTYGDSSSIFDNYKCDEIKPFYEICKQVGEQYLRKTKPEWEKKGESNKYNKRALGYGNSAQLFVTLNNVPTSTLTAIWAQGKIEINGKIIDWYPMFERREKKVGSEGHIDDKNLLKNKKTEINNNVLDYYLDIKDNSNQSFETALILPLRKEYATNPKDIIWNKSDSFIKNTIFVMNPDKNIETFSVKPSCLNFCNNRTKYKFKKENYDIKSINAYKIRIGDSVFGIIRLSFKKYAIILKTCINIVDSLSFIRTSSEKDNIIITARQNFTLSDIIHRVFEIDKDTKLIEPRLSAFSFFRISDNNKIFLNNSLNPFFNYKVSSSNVKDIYTNEENTLSLIEAIITLSSKGSALLCKSNYSDNNQNLQERFFKHFLFLYLLGKVQHDLQEKKYLNSSILNYSEDICLEDCEKLYYKKWVNLQNNGNI